VRNGIDTGPEFRASLVYLMSFPRVMRVTD
jgi:hypothetical protein